MPKISVIMPVYNTKSEYFKEAIQSILLQTYNNFELIIVDDCSDSYIKDIVLQYKDNRIFYYRTERNSGAAAARNLAISKARGEFLAFMDSDDVSLPNRFEEQLKYFQQNPQIGCLGTNIITISDTIKMKFPKHLRGTDIEQYLLFTGCAFCQSSVMLRREILEKNNIKYNSQYVPAEDYALWLDLVGKTKFAILDKTLLKYRYYPENISNRQKFLQEKKCAEAQIAALEKYCEFKLDNKDLLLSFFYKKSLPLSDLQKLNTTIDELITKMKMNNVFTPAALNIFKRKFKKLYYHTHSIKGQWQLFNSPINKVLNIKLYCRLFCFITRGIL